MSRHDPKSLTPGYVEMEVKDVIDRCANVIKYINLQRAKEDNKAIKTYINKHKKSWYWLPWYKPLTEIEAIESLKQLNFGLTFPSVSHHNVLYDTENLLFAARATKSNTMYVAAHAYILKSRFENNE